MKVEFNLLAYDGDGGFGQPEAPVTIRNFALEEGGRCCSNGLDIILGDDSADPGEMPGLLIENRNGEWFIGVSRNNGGDNVAHIHIPKDENKDIWAERGCGNEKFMFGD